jgi:hypothetical protein
MIAQILQAKRHVLADLAFQAGIDIDKVFSRLHYETHGTAISGNIAIDKKAAEGNPYIHVNEPYYHAASGKKYPNITFGTNAHGQENFVFNGYKESKGDDYSNVIVKPIKPRVVTQKELDAVINKENALKRATALFDGANSQGVIEHPYIVAKKVNVSGCDLRIINGRIVYALQNIDGNIISFQSTDAVGSKKLQKDCESGGGFNVIGGTIADCERGFIAVEGLSTGLTAYHNAKLNPKKKPVVVCVSAGNLSKVIGAFIGKFDNADVIELLADNDTGNSKAGNTGIYTALKVCNQYGIKSFYLPFDASDLRRKVDFNDVQTFEVVEAPETKIDYLADLIEVAKIDAITKEKGLLEQYGYLIAQKCPELPVNNAVDAIVKAVGNREIGIDADTLKARAMHLVSWVIKKRVERVRKNNRITDYNSAIRINVDGLTNAEIHAKLIELEKENPAIAIIDTRRKKAGKTQLMKLRADTMRGMAYGTHRVALVANACTVMNLTSYKEKDYHADKVGFCINSIKEHATAIKLKPLFIDETRQVNETVAIASTVKNRVELQANYAAALRDCKSLHCADADFDNATLHYLQKHADHLKFYVLETTESKVIDVEYNRIEGGLNAVKNGVLNDLQQGKAIMVGCSSDKRAIDMADFLTYHKIDESRILLIHGGNKGDAKQAAFLADMKAQLEFYDCIIYTSVLGSGVSLENEKFKTTWMYYSNVLPANENLQLMARNRCHTVVNVAFGNQGNANRVTSVETLKSGHIEKANEALKDLGGNYALDDLAMMSIEATAKVNQSLNNFVNDFLLLASIEGIEFKTAYAPIVTDLKFIKESAKATKAERINGIHGALMIDADTRKQLKNSHATTQQQTYSIKKFDAVEMTGGKDTDLTLDDVENFDKGYTSRLNNFELIDADTSKLRAIDVENFAFTQNKTKCLVSRQKIFKAFLSELQGNRIGKKEFQKACKVLKKYHLELAGEFGNYNKEIFKSPAKTAMYFLEKIGYEIAETTANDGVRFYEVKVNESIQRYALNRKGCS